MAQPDRYEPLPSLPELPGFLLRKLSRRGRRIAAVLAALLVAAVAFAAFAVIPDARRTDRERSAAEDRRAESRAAVLLARQRREGRPLTGSGAAAGGLSGGAALRARRALVGGLEAAILTDAQARDRRRELPGPYRDAACFEFPKGLPGTPPQDDLDRPGAVYECVAVSSAVGPDEGTSGALIGQPFRARVDFERGRFAWCKIVQRPGELSFDAEPAVRPARACGGT